MTLTDFRFETDADGIALATWDMPGRSMNVITEGVMDQLEQIIERVASDPALKGCVIATGKDNFSGGADLTMLQGLGRAYEQLKAEQGEEVAMRHFFEASRRLSLLFRRLETCGKPFAAAIQGLCLGGAFELALSCHHRIASDDGKTRVGSSEKVFDEAGYLFTPPCLWGAAADGLLAPPVLKKDTTLQMLTYFNSTYGHPGQMGIWQMKAAVAH